MEHGRSLDEAAITPYIPPELVHRTLSYISKDQAQLSACSLVCWSWCLEASPFVFEEVCVDSNGPHSWLSVGDFVDVLRQSPRMRKHIKKLTIHKVFDSVNFGQIMRLLPGLTHLGFSVGAFRMDVADNEGGTLQHLGGPPMFSLDVLTVWVYDYSGCHVQSALLILGMFARITHLSILGFIEDGILIRSPTAFHAVSVSRLTLSPLAIIDPLLSRLDRSKLSSLIIADASLETPSDLATVSRRLGPIVTELNFTGHIVAGPSNFDPTSQCPWPALTHLGFSITFFQVDYFINYTWLFAINNIRHAPQCLREVRFHLTLPTDTNRRCIVGASAIQLHLRELLAGLDFMSLADALECFPNLTTVHFILENESTIGESDLKEAKESLLAHFPVRTRASKLLRVDASKPAWATIPSLGRY